MAPELREVEREEDLLGSAVESARNQLEKTSGASTKSDVFVVVSEDSDRGDELGKLLAEMVEEKEFKQSNVLFRDARGGVPDPVPVRFEVGGDCRYVQKGL